MVDNATSEETLYHEFAVLNLQNDLDHAFLDKVHRCNLFPDFLQLVSFHVTVCAQSENELIEDLVIRPLEKGQRPEACFSQLHQVI